MRWVGVLILFLFACRAEAWTLVASGISGWVSGSVSVHFNPSSCTLSEEALDSIIDEALAGWNRVPGASLKVARATENVSVTVAEFLAGTAAVVPVILCDPSFGSNNGVDADFVPAATRMSSSGGAISYAGILLNVESGTGAEISALTREQMVITLAHEMGHVLGLGHSGKKEALMYFSIADKTKAILTEDDMDGVTYLYPRNEFNKNAFSCAATHAGGSPIGVLFSFLLVAPLAIFCRVRFRPGRLP